VEGRLVDDVREGEGLGVRNWSLGMGLYNDCTQIGRSIVSKDGLEAIGVRPESMLSNLFVSVLAYLPSATIDHNRYSVSRNFEAYSYC